MGLLDLELWTEVCPLGDWEGALRQGPVLEETWMKQIRRATHSGKPLANRDFVHELESRNGVDLEIRDRGRPLRKEVRAAATAAPQAS